MTMRKYLDILKEAETLRYPNGEVHHTEYDAPAEGSRIREKSTGREGVMVDSEPSHHGEDFEPDVFVAFDDDQHEDKPDEQFVTRLTLNEIEPIMTEDLDDDEPEVPPFTVEYFDEDPDGDEGRAGDGYYFQLDGEDSWSGAWHSEEEAEQEAWAAIEDRKADAERAARRQAAAAAAAAPAPAATPARIARP